MKPIPNTHFDLSDGSRFVISRGKQGTMVLVVIPPSESLMIPAEDTTVIELGDSELEELGRFLLDISKE